MTQSATYDRTRHGYVEALCSWWEARSRGEGAPFLTVLGPSGSGKLGTIRECHRRSGDATAAIYADGGFLTSGYFAGFEPLVRHAMCRAEVTAPELLRSSEPSLKRLFAHIPSSAYRLPLDLTNSSSRDERTRFYHHEYQLKLLNGLYEFLVAYFAASGERYVLVIDNAHALSPTVRSFMRLLTRRRGLDGALSVVLLSDAHHADPALAAVCDTVRLDPLDLAEATRMVRSWPHADELDARALRELWAAAHGNPALLAALCECARCGLDAADRLSSGAILDFYLTLRGERARRELLERYVRGHCIDDDPISVRNHDTYAEDARTALHGRAIAEHDDGEPARFVHHVSLGSTTQQLEALADGALALQEIGLYDTWFELLSPYYGSGALRVLPDGDQPHNAAFIRMAFVLYSLGLAPLAVPFLDVFYAAFPDSRLTPTALYAQSMAHGRYQVPVDLDAADRFATLNLAQIESIFRDHPKHTYIKVFAENALAYIRARQGRFDEALALCRSGIEEMRQVYGDERYRLHQSILVYNTGQIDEILGDFDSAYASYSEAIRMDPYYGEYQNDLANLLRRHDRLEQALEHYERAIELCPPYYEAHLNRGSVHAELGDRVSAEADYLRTIELQPTEAAAYLGLGTLALEARDFERARGLFDDAIYHAPRNADAYSNRALAHRGCGDDRAALADLHVAIELRPRFAEAYNNRATVHFAQGDLDASLRDLDEALALDDKADYLRNRAVLYEALGRDSDAQTDLATAGG